MHRWLSIIPMLMCLAGAFAGCASIESTMVTRDETNQHWERHNCLNGIPITLKVPTHLKLYVFHKHYLQAIREQGTQGTAGSPAVGITPEIPQTASAPGKIIDYQPVDVGVVIRDFAQELMYTDKVFVVDFKRPASGSANLKVKMTDQQYIDKIQHDITDNTISDVRGLLAAAKGTTPNEPLRTVGGDLATANELRSLVAVGIFEIDAPDFEQKVRDFVECHINKSHDAWFAPPGVRCVNRVGLGPHDNGDQPYPPNPLCPCNEPFNRGGPPLPQIPGPYYETREPSVASPAPVISDKVR